jgi:hypothetical protein
VLPLLEPLPPLLPEPVVPPVLEPALVPALVEDAAPVDPVAPEDDIPPEEPEGVPALELELAELVLAALEVVLLNGATELLQARSVAANVPTIEFNRILEGSPRLTIARIYAGMPQDLQRGAKAPDGSFAQRAPEISWVSQAPMSAAIAWLISWPASYCRKSGLKPACRSTRSVSRALLRGNRVS